MTVGSGTGTTYGNAALFPQLGNTCITIGSGYFTNNTIASGYTGDVSCTACLIWTGGAAGNHWFFERGSSGVDGWAVRNVNQAAWSWQNTTIQAVNWGVGPTPSTTYHLVASYNSTTHVATLYINGVSQGTVSMSSNYNAPSAGALIGDPGGGSTTFTGSLSNIAFFHSQLSQSNVTALYNAATVAKPKGGGASVAAAAAHARNEARKLLLQQQDYQRHGDQRRRRRSGPFA